MRTTAEWLDVVQAIRDGGGPWASPRVVELYQLAREDGRELLSTFRDRLDDERRYDLVHDLLAEQIAAIVAAENPRAFFLVSLKHRAITWLRRPAAEVRADLPSDDTSASDASTAADPAFVIDARAALNMLNARDRDIAIALGQGVDRELIAAAHGTTRANVDQIISRLRRRFAEGDS